MTEEELEQRKAEDFKLFLLAHAKGNPAMYELLRDRSLDEAKDDPEKLEEENWLD